MNPELLLHICCGPDATTAFERLHPEFKVTGYFHNPNIHPESEYCKRLAAVETVSSRMGFPLQEAPYQPDAWRRAVCGLEREPEKGRRCQACFLYNLRATAAKATELGMPHFTTSLTVSPHKNAADVFAAGEQAGREHGVAFVAADFKKRDGFRRSLELSNRFGLYRQNYCGCMYSLRVADCA